MVPSVRQIERLEAAAVISFTVAVIVFIHAARVCSMVGFMGLFLCDCFAGFLGFFVLAAESLATIPGGESVQVVAGLAAVMLRLERAPIPTKALCMPLGLFGLQRFARGGILAAGAGYPNPPANEQNLTMSGKDSQESGDFVHEFLFRFAVVGVAVRAAFVVARFLAVATGKGRMILAVHFLHCGRVAANVGVMLVRKFAIFGFDFFDRPAILEKVHGAVSFLVMC
jgi:hypothetical protein